MFDFFLKMIKRIIKFLLPYGIYKIISNINKNYKPKLEKEISNNNLFEILKNNDEIKNYKSKNRAFLLATGPSIKQENLKLLQGEDCFSISNFFLHPDISVIKPKFHFFAAYHPPLILEEYINWLKKADETLPAETNIILDISTKQMVDQYDLFSNRKIYYLLLRSVDKIEKIDLKSTIMAPQTGPLMILPVLISMGYEKIYLLGCDHDVLKYYKSNIENFYDNKDDPRRNATDKNSWEGIIESHIYSMNVFIQYKKYIDYINENKINSRIINLSKNSWLDFVEMNNLENIISKQGVNDDR